MATAESKSSQFSLVIFSTRSSAPTASAPASCASLALSPLANTTTRVGLAGAVRQVDGAAHHLVGVLGIDAEADGEVDGLVELRRDLQLRQERERLVDRVLLVAVDLFESAARYFLPVLSDDSVDDLEAHRARGAFDGADRRLEVGGVQVGQLELRDVADLLLGDLADLVLVGLARALLDLRPPS